MLCQQHLHVIRIYTPVMRGVVKLDVNSSIHTVLDESVYCLVSLKDEPNANPMSYSTGQLPIQR